MESTEREYYQALFRRDFGEARRLFRVLAVSDWWEADHVQYEGQKCGVYDEGSYPDEWDVVEPAATVVMAGIELPAAA